MRLHTRTLNIIVCVFSVLSIEVLMVAGFVPSHRTSGRQSSNRSFTDATTSSPTTSTTTTSSTRTTTTTTPPTRLFMSLKPAAIPMMDSGKALARSGELLVDLTSTLGLYGGALSSAGAQIRNSGDCVAQAAASCRFKTGTELVCDELREGATCLGEATDKLRQAIEEANVDEDSNLATELVTTVSHTGVCAKTMEEAGAGIMQRKSVAEIGSCLVQCGEGMKQLAISIQALAPTQSEAKESSQRMLYAADRMVLAGTELQGTTEKPKGGRKAWLKGG